MVVDMLEMCLDRTQMRILLLLVQTRSCLRTSQFESKTSDSKDVDNFCRQKCVRSQSDLNLGWLDAEVDVRPKNTYPSNSYEVR